MIIKELVTQIRGVSYKPTDVVNSNKGIPILRANNINNDAIIFDDLVYVNPSRINEKQYLKKGDILICTSSGSKTLVGKAGRFESYSQPVAFGAFCKVLRVNDNPKINKEYIRLFFRSSLYRNMIAELSNGANINNIKTENIDYLNVNVPSIEIQSKAVSLFESLIKALNQKKYQLDCLEELINSRFVEMFGDPVLNPKAWPTKPLLEMGSCKNGMNFHNTDSGIMLHCLGVGDFKNHSIITDAEELPMVSLSEMPSDEYLLRDDDIVFVRSNGNKALVGRSVAIYPGTTPTTFSGFCIRYRKNDETITVPYLLRALKTDSMRQKMAGRGASIQNLNQKILGSLIIPVPPKELQYQFAGFISQIDKSKSIVKQQIKDLQELLDKKMDEYFNS